MTVPDSGVDLLLRRATDDLRPDVEHLVAGGITRGRTRRRRARIGTAVAAVAVFGVIGAAAAAVPLGGDPDAVQAPIATDPPVPETPSVAPLEPAQGLAVPADEIQETVNLILDRSPAAGDRPGESGGDERSRTAHFLYDGMLTTVVIEKGTLTMAQCAEQTCEELPDGSTRLEWGPGTADGVTAHGVTWWRRGYSVSALSYNAAEGKESPPLAPEPPLSKEQLRLVAGSDVWFG
ncbi:hypothetical protein [Nocardioides allogilvus]|uniref:hypothetical protein n=1 Tax=Nocardioides allogilvus TaxID=2072017 RepID=UPI000D2F84B5|nr:hypothetical protein [Nocardioides allogilvus]